MFIILYYLLKYYTYKTINSYKNITKLTKKYKKKATVH